MAARDRKLFVCAGEDLPEKQYIILDLLYRNQPHSGIVFRFNGALYAYLNQCVHMPRALNCQRDTIFDEKRALLRCSMHGIVYEPETGRSLSTMCHGEKLQALRLDESDGKVYIIDKRVSPVHAG
jgi:nitrite reductase/ring-hydroxylating ferredoxin subunit